MLSGTLQKRFGKSDKKSLRLLTFTKKRTCSRVISQNAHNSTMDVLTLSPWAFQKQCFSLFLQLSSSQWQWHELLAVTGVFTCCQCKRSAKLSDTLQKRLLKDNWHVIRQNAHNSNTPVYTYLVSLGIATAVFLLRGFYTGEKTTAVAVWNRVAKQLDAHVWTSL